MKTPSTSLLNDARAALEKAAREGAGVPEAAAALGRGRRWLERLIADNPALTEGIELRRRGWQKGRPRVDGIDRKTLAAASKYGTADEAAAALKISVRAYHARLARARERAAEPAADSPAERD